MYISNRIKELRNKLCLTQQDFCKEIGISQGTLSDMESGKTKPSFDTLVAINEKFNISLDYLMVGINDVPAEYPKTDFSNAEIQLVNDFRKLKKDTQMQISAYIKIQAALEGNIAESSSSKIG